MGDRLMVDFGTDGRASVGLWLDGKLQGDPPAEPYEVAWSLDEAESEDLRWYLEDYLRAPYGVYGHRGVDVANRLAGWGEAIFESLFGSGPARAAYLQARARGSVTEVVLRSASPAVLGLPWELMRDPARPSPLALDLVGVSRCLPSGGQASFEVPGKRLRVMMVISRPAGGADVGYRMIARPLLERVDAVRGAVDLVVLRPPTLGALHQALVDATRAGEPFQIVHFDGHGVLADRHRGTSRGSLVFEKPGGGRERVPAEVFAQVLATAEVPVVVLNACQSGAVGKELETAVATRLLQEGAASVVAMAYRVYAVAAAEFMAAFYERLFSGGSLTQAVSAGRRRLYQHDLRPSAKGLMALADWLVPVHYLGRDVRFPGLRAKGSLNVPRDDALDSLVDGPDSAAPGLESVGGFVGRDALFYDLEVATRLRRVVVLYGPGGIGKTELAKAFGRWWADTGGVALPDWVIVHSFEPGVASIGLDGLIAAVGLRVFGSDFARFETSQRRAMIEELLTEQRLLLILDNFETVAAMPDPSGATPPLDVGERDELRAFVQRRAAHGASAVIITSRSEEPWLGDLPRIPLGGLTTGEAIEYAEQLLAPYRAAAPRRATPAFGELLDRLDGHPLAMRLVLPHLQTTEPETLLAALDGVGDLPGADGGGRTTSLAACVAYSFDHLSISTARLAVVLCLCHGIADADALALFSQQPGAPSRFRGATRQQWGEILEEAAAVGLLTGLGAAGMYQIHPALPAFLAPRWRNEESADHDNAQRRAATAALLDAYVERGEWLYSEILRGNAHMAYTVIGLQRRTLGALLGLALDTRRWEQAQGIAQPLNEYWMAKGLYEEGRGWVNRARAALGTVDGVPPLEGSDGALWLFFVGSQAERESNAGRLDAAESTHLEILAMLQAQTGSSEQRRRLAVAYHQLGTIAQRRGQLDNADDWYRQSLTIKSQLGNRRGMAASYHQLGTIAQSRGRVDVAEDWYYKALAISEDLHNRPAMATTYHQLGILAHDRGHLGDAHNWYQQSLAIRQELGNLPGMAATYHQLGNVAERRRRLDEAEDWYLQSLVIEEQLGNRPGMASSYHQLGVVAQRRGGLDQAEEWHRQSLAIYRELGDRPGMAISYHQLAMVAQGGGRLDQAEDLYRQALAIYEELGDRPGMAISYHQLAMVAQWRGRLDQAEERLNEAEEHFDQAEDGYRQSLAIDEELGNRPGMATTYHQLGNLAHDRGRLDQAEAWYLQSVAIKADLGNRPGMATSYAGLGLLSEERGSLAEALEWMVRSVTVFYQFPDPAPGPSPAHLARLTTALGIDALRSAWAKVTGRPLPKAVQQFVESQPDAGGYRGDLQ